MSAAEARARLLELGLSYGGILPTPGEPGVVLRSFPPFGERVAPGRLVIIYIGAEAERIQVEETPTAGE
jgi:beta-lactam-binding protein with PASTA domain